MQRLADGSLRSQWRWQSIESKITGKQTQKWQVSLDLSIRGCFIAAFHDKTPQNVSFLPVANSASHSLLNRLQSGVYPHYSIKTTLVKVTNDPHNAKLNSWFSVLILFDLLATLNPIVSHLFLLESLSSLGFPDTTTPDSPSPSVSLATAFLHSVPPRFLNLLKLGYPRAQSLYTSLLYLGHSCSNAAHFLALTLIDVLTFTSLPPTLTSPLISWLIHPTRHFHLNI